MHPTARTFMNLSLERVAARYAHLHPAVCKAALRAVLSHKPKHMHWAGADLMHVTSADGRKSMVLIETNVRGARQGSRASVKLTLSDS